MKTYVLYHANCPDGFGAAWAAYRSLGDGDDVEYIPVRYGSPLPEIDDGSTVYIVDFSYPRAVLEELAGRVELKVFDHHKSAAADLAGLDFCVYDMERSGAVITWEEFHPGEPVPLLLQYVQDHDLWRFDMRFTRRFRAWLRSSPMEFSRWDFIHGILVEFGGVPLSYVTEGGAILRSDRRLVESMADRAVMMDIGGHTVPVANASMLFSDVGEELCKRHPDAAFAGYYFDRADGMRQWGLRSCGGGVECDDVFDVSEVARLYGGGGHRGAAGFAQRLPEVLLTPPKEGGP